MATKIIIIVAGSIAAVVAVFILGKMADGKDTKTDNQPEQKN